MLMVADIIADYAIFFTFFITLPDAFFAAAAAACYYADYFTLLSPPRLPRRQMSRHTSTTLCRLMFSLLLLMPR